MSADNGIYILKTIKKENPDGYEYRVEHMQAVDNVDWDNKKKDYSDDDNIRIKNARKMWKKSEVFSDEQSAMEKACKIDKQVSWTEYGICIISINKEF